MRAIHGHRPDDWFWIDALCINQSSNDEKSDQVPRMREIYETSCAGFIWLGDATINADHSPDDGLFATEYGFAGWARSSHPHQSPCDPAPPLPGHSVCKDDIVIVPRGASLPWVIRETDMEGEYELITDGGVHGIMQVESGKLQTQRYTLV